MTQNVSTASLAGAVKVTVPDSRFSTKEKQTKNLKNGFYWIQRTTMGGNVLEPEIAYFIHANGRSLYLGKWQIFDHVSLKYHDDKIKVIGEIKAPVIA